MPSSFERAQQYRDMVEEVVASGLLDEDEWMQLGDLLKRVERKVQATQPAKSEAAE